jgi:enoyl-CoA hydratase
MRPTRYERFDALHVDQPEKGILRFGMRFDAVERGHGQLGLILKEINEDPEVRVGIVGGDAELGEEGMVLMNRVATEWDVRLRLMQEAADLVYNTINCSKPLVSAFPGAGTALAVGLLADISVAGRSTMIADGHTSYGAVAGDHAVLSWPLLCGMAKAKYYLLTGEPLTGEEAERIGLVSLCVEDDAVEETVIAIARKLEAGSQRALRWTKGALNNWYRSAGPAFDASLALEFITFGGPDVAEGLDAIASNRSPIFPEQY